MGPTLSFRGIDNAELLPARRRRPGALLRHHRHRQLAAHALPHVLQLIMDSLRYWVTEMHVDGFRFDLAATLARAVPRGRPPVGVLRPGAPGPGRLARSSSSPSRGTSATAATRSAASRRCGRSGTASTATPSATSGAASRPRSASSPAALSGSSDLYEHTGRRPIASVNFVTAHDGFTLNDLVSYNEKHNEANGEGNNDGESHNRSWNCGVEGPTDDPAILALRARQQRNFLATLLLSQGVPMLAHGDELGRTQQGNNNVYCQDTELSWIDWDLDEDKKALLEFTRRSSRSARTTPCSGAAASSPASPTSAASPTARHRLARARRRPTCPDEAWDADHARAVTVFLNGDAIAEPDPRGQEIVDDSFLVLFNGQPTRDVHVPEPDFGEVWTAVVDTDSQIEAGARSRPERPGAREKSIIVLTGRRRPPTSSASARPPPRREAAKQTKTRRTATRPTTSRSGAPRPRPSA